MKLVLVLADHFGESLSNGAIAAPFLAQYISPHLANNEEVTLDFSGIRSANSSFMNALFCEMLSVHGAQVLDKVDFKGCTKTVEILIVSALQLGLDRAYLQPGGVSV